jgi:hypothetical protein
VFVPGSSEAEAARQEQDKASSAIADETSKEAQAGSLLEKGKNLLFGKK